MRPNLLFILSALLLLPLVACDDGGDEPARPGAVEEYVPEKPALRGIVIADRGEPVPGARVLARLPVGAGRAGWEEGVETETDAGGEFTLDIASVLERDAPDEIPVFLEVTADGYVLHRSRLATYRPGFGARVEVRMVLAGGLRGVVRTGEGAPVAGARVYVMPAAMAGEPDPRRPPQARTGEDGTFEIPGLPMGTFDVGVAAEGYLPAMARDAQVVVGRTREVPPIEVVPGGSVSGRVVTPDGKPVRKATVIAFRKRPLRQYVLFGRATIAEAGGRAETDEEGRFTIGGLADAEYTVEAEAMGHNNVASSIPGVKVGRSDLKLVLEPEMELELLVVDERTRKPVGTFSVAVSDLSGESRRTAVYQVSSPVGSFVTAVRPGTPYRIEVSADGYRVLAKTIRLEGGEAATRQFVLTPR